MESSAINWSKILIYGSVLFFAQFATGLVEGFFSPYPNVASRIETIFWFALSTLTSLIVSTSIFAHMAIHQSSRPFLHASLSLAIYGAASFGLSAVLKPFFGSPQTLLVYFGWLTLLVGLLAGVLIGRAASHKHGNNQKGVV